MKKIKKYPMLIAFILIFGVPLSAYAGDNILIAAASNLRFVMHDICTAFQAANPSVQTKVSYGSSGNFFAQIKQGAPFDIFFSADAAYPELLEKEGLTAKGAREVYAVGKIVLWFPKGHKGEPDKGWAPIISSGVKKLAIANPRHAPYGRAAEESLRYYGLWDKVKNKLIYGENISQTAQFVSAGAADAGIIALSLAISSRMLNEGKYWNIPDESHGDIEQVYVVLKKGQGKRSVGRFLDFLHGEEGSGILSGYGFIIPGIGEDNS